MKLQNIHLDFIGRLYLVLLLHGVNFLCTRENKRIIKPSRSPQEGSGVQKKRPVSQI